MYCKYCATYVRTFTVDSVPTPFSADPLHHQERHRLPGQRQRPQEAAVDAAGPVERDHETARHSEQVCCVPVALVARIGGLLRCTSGVGSKDRGTTPVYQWCW